MSGVSHHPQETVIQVSCVTQVPWFRHLTLLSTLLRHLRTEDVHRHTIVLKVLWHLYNVRLVLTTLTQARPPAHLARKDSIVQQPNSLLQLETAQRPILAMKVQPLLMVKSNATLLQMDIVHQVLWLQQLALMVSSSDQMVNANSATSVRNALWVRLKTALLTSTAPYLKITLTANFAQMALTVTHSLLVAAFNASLVLPKASAWQGRSWTAATLVTSVSMVLIHPPHSMGLVLTLAQWDSIVP